MSAPLPVRTCPVKHCGKLHPTAHVTATGCPSCSLGLLQVAAYAEHRARLLTDPAYAEQAARREHSYYHPVEPENRS